MHMQFRQRGFTLPELLVASVVIIALLATLALSVSASVDTAPRRDAERRLEVAKIAQAIDLYRTEQGAFPPTITEKEQFVGSGQDESNLCADLVPIYLENMPFDPLGQTLGDAKDCPDDGGDYITGYSVRRTGNDTIVISAPFTEATKPEVRFEKSY